MPLNIETREKIKEKENIKVMGMSASQMNIFFYTNRKADIMRQQQSLSTDRMALTREMRKVSEEYNRDLNKKVLKWSNNNGATYVDLSYQNIMRPGLANKDGSYVLTDSNGKVVIDPKYKKYAEMLSSNGSPSNNWSGDTRAEILSQLTGISSDKIKEKESADIRVKETHQALHALGVPPEKETETNFNLLLGKMGSSKMENDKTWQQNYSANGTIELGSGTTAANKLENLVNQLSNKLAPYFGEYSENFKEACELVSDNYSNLIKQGTDLSTNQDGIITGKSDGYKVNIKALVDNIIGSYDGPTVISEGYGNEEVPIWYDIDDANYDKKYREWKTKYDTANTNYTEALEHSASILTADEKSTIQFYDKIFSTVAEKGWTFNDNVEDTEYLNQMLQNNLYTITSVDRGIEYNNTKNSYEYRNSYETNIASNFEQIYTVADSDIRADALNDYEYKKSLIKEKETRIDLRMQDLSTELATINQMIQSIDAVKKDNIERTFGIFS